MGAIEMVQVLGNLGEFVGAIAVVITLAYLGIQVRQNTKATKAATYSETTRGWQDYLQAMTRDDLELLMTLGSNLQALSAAEFLRASYLCRVLFRRMEHDFYQHRAGLFEAGTWNAYVKAFERDTFNSPVIRAMWQLQREFLDPAFVASTDRIVERARARIAPGLRASFAELLEAERRASARPVQPT
jgi:hypothetical protein